MRFMDMLDFSKWLSEAGGVAAAMAAACTGSLMKRAHLRRDNGKPFFTRDLLLELPIAAGIGVIGLGISEYLGFDGGYAQAGIISACGYLGPPAIDAVFQAITKRIK